MTRLLILLFFFVTASNYDVQTGLVVGAIIMGALR